MKWSFEDHAAVRYFKTAMAHEAQVSGWVNEGQAE